MRRYKTAILSALVLIIGSSFFVPAASAQPVCSTHRTVSDSLKKSYAEAPVSMGVTAGGGVIEVYASPKGTWTLVITQPNGTSCLIAAGQGWKNLPKPEMISGTRT
jgi:hypothetical protein|tara:strand:+ start:1258 stop:1575 length:318 start_codon:yes stop_codon:yes gene_type:complete